MVYKFKAGDRVQIKEWDEMMKEFGTMNGRTIACGFGFVERMKPLCGRIATIAGILNDSVKLKDWSDDSGNVCWNFSADMIKPVSNTSRILIETDGKTVTASRYINGKKEVAIAKCSPEDTLNFEIGAKLALKRLFEPEPKFKVGDKVTVIGNTKYCHGFAIDEVVTIECFNCDKSVVCIGGDGLHQTLTPEDIAIEPLKKIIDSHTKLDYGVIGTKTMMKDINKEPLYVGDTVELFSSKLKRFGNASVVMLKFGGFVMGISCDCDRKTGAIKDWYVVKRKSFRDISVGEKLNHGLMVIEE